MHKIILILGLDTNRNTDWLDKKNDRREKWGWGWSEGLKISSKTIVSSAYGNKDGTPMANPFWAQVVSTNRKLKQNKTELMFKILTWCLWEEKSVNNWRSDVCPEVTEQSCRLWDSHDWSPAGSPHSLALSCSYHRLSASSQHYWLLSGNLLDPEISPQRLSPWAVSSSFFKLEFSWL